MKRIPIIAANWKMHKTASEADEFIKTIKPRVHDSCLQVFLAVPSTVLSLCFELLVGSEIQVGAQNIHDQKFGAYTGEISASMVKDSGASFAIVGHSERRVLFQESNEFIRKKIKAAIDEDIQPLLCIGESEKERNLGATEAVIHSQLSECLAGFSAGQLEKLIIAYEPIWAIGTGKTATPQMAEEVHCLIREHLARLFYDEFSKRTRILYGGSVKPQNAASLLKEPNIDGALIGGASLEADSFLEIFFHARDVIS